MPLQSYDFGLLDQFGVWARADMMSTQEHIVKTYVILKWIQGHIGSY